MLDETIGAVSFVGSTPIAQYIYARACANGKRAQCFGGAKNHLIVMPDADMDQVVNDLLGAAYGSAGERCMALPVAVPVGEGTAEEEDLSITWTGAEYMSGGGIPADHVAYDASGDVTDKDVQLTDFTLQDGDVGIASNYEVSITLGQARILPKVLELDGRARGKTYDGTSEADVVKAIEAAGTTDSAKVAEVATTIKRGWGSQSSKPTKSCKSASSSKRHVLQLKTGL